MPEGDVLRLTAERLDAALSGHPLTVAALRWPTAATTHLTGVAVQETTAYGKHLLTRFVDGRTLHTHLRMDGSWHVARTGSREADGRSPQVRALLGNDRWTCVGYRLGMLDVVRTRDEPALLGHLGPDILGPKFVEPGTDSAIRPQGRGLVAAIERCAADPARPLAEVLLDQRTVAGLGTIWTAESLFARRIWPWTPAGTVDSPALASLLLSARFLMERSIRVARIRGLDAVERAVHGRAGRPCRRCGTAIARGTANPAPYERPIFWCPTCQASR